MAGITLGQMNRRVTFQVVDKTTDSSRGSDEEYTDLLSTWAYVEDKGGSRNFLSGSDKVEDNKNIYVQYRTDLMDNLTNDTRILYNGMDYSIERYSMVDEVKRIIKFETSGSR